MQLFIHSFIHDNMLKTSAFFLQYREQYLHLGTTLKGSSGQTGILRWAAKT